MIRYFITIAYRGTHYNGWQKQPNANGVQQFVEEALTKILGVNTSIVGSGRTDSGVHASGQIFHVDIQQEVNIDQILFAANKILPHDISLLEVRVVNNEAHARFDAELRSYEYHIVLKKNPFKADLAYYNTQKLDVSEMNSAASLLLEFEDFESFSKVKTDVFTFNCKIFEAEWKQEEDTLVFHISANRFLRGMVRAIVGTLLDVGLGKVSLAEFSNIILQKDRSAAGRAVPAHGLFLTEVTYPKDIFI